MTKTTDLLRIITSAVLDCKSFAEFHTFPPRFPRANSNICFFSISTRTHWVPLVLISVLIWYADGCGLVRDGVIARLSKGDGITRQSSSLGGNCVIMLNFKTMTHLPAYVRCCSAFFFLIEQQLLVSWQRTDANDAILMSRKIFWPPCLKREVMP